jgi:hypothetical protein
MNSLANFCFLSSSDNQKIKDKSPSEYIEMIPSGDRTQIFERAILSDSWHSKRFEHFFCQRVDDLVAKAATLSALNVPQIKFMELYAKIIPLPK